MSWGLAEGKGPMEMHSRGLKVKELRLAHSGVLTLGMAPRPQRSCLIISSFKHLLISLAESFLEIELEPVKKNRQGIF